MEGRHAGEAPSSEVQRLKVILTHFRLILPTKQCLFKSYPTACFCPQETKIIYENGRLHVQSFSRLMLDTHDPD